MDNIIPTNEYTELEGRYYANPQVSLDGSNQFIDNLRAIQGTQNQEIARQTQNLGTEVPSNLGGLTGGESYFTSRYQTPQTNAVVSDLRAVAQAKALNDALANEQAIWTKRYQDTYRAYQKRQNEKANRIYSSGGGGDNNNQSGWSGETDLVSTDETLDTSTPDGTSTPDETQPQTPPKESDYMITGEEQTQKIEERTGLPAWLINILKIFG